MLGRIKGLDVEGATEIHGTDGLKMVAEVFVCLLEVRLLRHSLVSMDMEMVKALMAGPQTESVKDAVVLCVTARKSYHYLDYLMCMKFDISTAFGQFLAFLVCRM